MRLSSARIEGIKVVHVSATWRGGKAGVSWVSVCVRVVCVRVVREKERERERERGDTHTHLPV
jgi:hypothetical protein